jgi:hypothetical protein
MDIASQGRRLIRGGAADVDDRKPPEIQS